MTASKKPTVLDKIDNNLFYTYINANKNIKAYLEFKKQQYGQNTIIAALNQFFFDVMKNDEEWQLVIKPKDEHKTA